jgi:hypothetical protein
MKNTDEKIDAGGNTNMDRKPKPAPFKVGTKLRFIGTTHSWTYDINPETREKKEVPLQVPGMVVTVAEVRPGRQGTLCHCREYDGALMYWDDTGEPILDETKDGYNVYYVEAYQSGKKQGRCIDRENKKEWEVVA